MDAVTLAAARADAKRKYGLAQRHVWVPVSQRAIPPVKSRSNGTDTGANTRLLVKVAASCYDLRLVFTGYYNSGGQETDLANSYGVRASVDDNGGRIFWATFNGNPDGVVFPGCTLVSDPIPAFTLAAGASVFCRSWVTVGSGGKWPLGVNSVIASGEGSDHAAITPVDKTRSGTIATSAERIFHPAAVLARLTYPGQRVLGVIGDSIPDGSGDTLGDLGWTRRWLNDHYCSQFVCMTSATLTFWMGTNGVNAQRQARLLENCTDILITLGINGVSDPNLLTNVQTLAARYTARGCTIHVATLLPNGADESFRTAYNDAVRAHPAWITGSVLDIADLVETSRNSGVWKAGYTDGQPHPNATGAAAIAAGLPATTTVLGPVAT